MDLNILKHFCTSHFHHESKKSVCTLVYIYKHINVLQTLWWDALTLHWEMSNPSAFSDFISHPCLPRISQAMLRHTQITIHVSARRKEGTVLHVPPKREASSSHRVTQTCKVLAPLQSGSTSSGSQPLAPRLECSCCRPSEWSKTRLFIFSAHQGMSNATRYFFFTVQSVN